MRIVALAYHNIGYRCLEVLIGGNQNVVAVFTHQDAPGENIWFDSVADLSRAHQIPCYFPDNINDSQWIDLLKNLKPDLIFSFYFRQMVSKNILNIPRHGAINLHGSYLPKYRGRCPVNWVLVNGEKETGVTLHYMVESPDAGDIIAQAKVPIDFEDTALTLFQKMERAAASLLGEALPLIVSGTNPRIPQDLSKGSYFGGRRPEDGQINWTRGNVEIYNLIRAVTRPYPGAFAYLDRKKIVIWEARVVDDLASRGNQPPGSITIEGDDVLVTTGQGAIRIVACQVDGDPERRLGGIREILQPGDRFDSQERVA